MSKHGGEYFCGSVHDSDYESVDGFADEIYKLTFIPFGEDIPCVQMLNQNEYKELELYEAYKL